MGKPKVNLQTCIGCGACAAICPAVFKLNAEGKVEVIELPDYTPHQKEIQDAISSCPVQAITL